MEHFRGAQTGEAAAAVAVGRRLFRRLRWLVPACLRQTACICSGWNMCGPAGRGTRTLLFRSFPDYRWKTLNPGRPFIGLGPLLAAFHYDKAASPCPPRLAWRKWTRLRALHLGVVCMRNQHLNRKNRRARPARLNPLSGCAYRSRPYA